jgi:hypothetical protein
VTKPPSVVEFDLPFYMANTCTVDAYHAAVIIPKDTLKFKGTVMVDGIPAPSWQPNADTSWIYLSNALPNYNIPPTSGDRNIFNLKFERVVPVNDGNAVNIPFDNSVPSRNHFQSQTWYPGCWIDVYGPVPGNPDTDLVLVNGKVTFQNPPPPPPPGCPFVYVWNGKGFVEDNTILTASEYKKEPVADYYLLTQTPQLKDGKYHLQLREFEQEKSYLDNLELISVDHSPDVKVGVTPEGKIFAYDQEVALLGCVDKDGVDQLSKVEDKDQIYYTCQEAGELILDFGNYPGDNQGALGLPARPKPPNPDSPNKLSTSKSTPERVSPLSVAVLDQKGNWIKISDLPPRSNQCTVFALADPGQINMGDRLKIKLSWEDKYEVDRIRFYLVNQKKELKVNACGLSLGSHSRNGKISSLLAAEDKAYVNLVPDEKMDLYFSAKGEPGDGLVRDFILVSRGYYEKLQDSYPPATTSAPKEFALFDNYPNPFNPNTEITYSLPQDAKVNLTIYNLLGEKVKTLADEYQTAGYKTVPWDGTDENGEVVSSGVYFYRLSAGNFTQAKKMILIK